MIEARQRDTVCHQGEVDTVFTSLGVLWLLKEPPKDRKFP